MMTTQKKSPLQFTGRYGEKIRDLHEIELSRQAEFMLMTGIGVDKEGQERLVIFEVSRATKKKDGKYCISSNGRLPISYNTVLLSCEYKEDLLDGKEYVYGNGGLIVNTWHQGKKISPNPVRDDQATKAKHVRKLFSDESVLAAIRTGDPKKVKSAMTRASIKSTSKKVKEKE